jgi:hypothetical protein
LLAMDVNDDAPCLNVRGVPALAPTIGLSTSGGLVGCQAVIASKPAPTVDPGVMISVGASLLAMDVNDDAPCLTDRGVPAYFASRLAPTLD